MIIHSVVDFLSKQVKSDEQWQIRDFFCLCRRCIQYVETVNTTPVDGVVGSDIDRTFAKLIGYDSVILIEVDK